MVWTFIERAVHIATLMLLILMMTIIFTNNKSGEDRINFSLQLDQVKQDNARVMTNNITYLETKINRVAESQDNYQNTTSTRVYLLEKRIEKIEQGSKLNNKVINTNNNVNVINGVATPSE